MPKIKVSNISSTAIIFKASDPRQIFIDMKDGGLPVHVFRWTMCPIGGNWVGKGAEADGSPLGTFKREFREEFSIRVNKRDWSDAVALGLTEENPSIGNGMPKEDSTAFYLLREKIIALATPWRDYLVPVSTRVLDLMPGNKREGFTTLNSYNLVALDDNDWNTLVDLQQRYENLSNESLSYVTSLDEIEALGRRFAYGHEYGLTDFWKDCGLGTTRVQRFDHNAARSLGAPRHSYQDYVDEFDIAKRP